MKPREGVQTRSMIRKAQEEEKKQIVDLGE